MKGEFKLNLRPATPTMDALNVDFAKIFGPCPFPPITAPLDQEIMAQGDECEERR